MELGNFEGAVEAFTNGTVYVRERRERREERELSQIVYMLIMKYVQLF